MRLRTYRFSVTRGVQNIKTKTALLLSAAGLALAGTGGMAVTLLHGASADTPVVVKDGSFEDGSVSGAFTTVYANDGTTIPDWTVTSGSVDYINNYWTASDGHKSIDMSGNDAGAISQTITTVPGHTYNVTFDLAGNPDYGPGLKTLNVSAGNTTMPYVFNVTTQDKTHMGWQKQLFSFTATATSTDLTFTSTTPGPVGPALDNVAVNDVDVPTPTTVTVTDLFNQGWQKTAQYAGGSIDYVTATGADGNGALQFTTPTNDSYTRYRKSYSLPLNSLTALSYETKQVTVGGPAAADAAVNLRLYINTSGGNTVDDVLVYEPYYNGTVSPDWKTWNAIDGYWWSNNNVTYNGHSFDGAGSYATNFRLSDVLASYPDAKVVSVGLGTGDYNAPWTVQADDLRVNNTIYNFEKNVDKTACMNNGWKAATGGVFKNQGDCVSYFATNGKNQPSGKL